MCLPDPSGHHAHGGPVQAAPAAPAGAPALDHVSPLPANAPPLRTSRRALLQGIAGASAVSLLAGRSSPAAATDVRPPVIDLTHPFSPTFPTYPIVSPPTRHPVHHVETSGFYMQHWQLWEHTSTHLDAPAHFIVDGRTVPEIGLEELVGRPLCVVDISRRAAADHDTTVTVHDLRTYEREHGRIPPGAVVLMDSGWASRVSVPGAYQNPGTDGRLHSPGWSVEAIDWLLDGRDVTGIGVDTLSLDRGDAVEEFPAHLAWLGADRWALECVANLDQVPPRGTRIVVGVTPYEEGSGAPCRVMALPEGRLS